MGRKPKEKNPSIDTTRSLNWTLILYPESAPENWRAILDEEFCIEWIEGPLHDKDINPDGEPKKPHIHIILLFGSVKSFEQVSAIQNKLNAALPKRVHNLRSMIRYLVHLDNPEKFQYDRRQIIPHGGANLDSAFLPSSHEEISYLKDIIVFIYENGVTEFCDLVNHYIKTVDDDHLYILKTRHHLINTYITSYRNKYHMEA